MTFYLLNWEKFECDFLILILFFKVKLRKMYQIFIVLIGNADEFQEE